ncbi:MAG: YCF48-related protein [Pseudomonadota bacterium]
MMRVLARWVLPLLAAVPVAVASQEVTDQLDLPALMAEQAPEAALLDLVVVDDRLVAVGERGVVLTRDGEEAWLQRSVPLSATLTAVDFNDAGVGVAVGHDGVILRSPDRGETWEKITDGRSLFRSVISAAEARYAGAQTALASATDDTREDLEFALEDEEFRRETAQQSLEYGPAWPLLDVAFSQAGVVWAVGAYGTLFRSADTGASWDLVSARIENAEDLHLNAVLRTRGGDLVMAGEGGLLFHSSNGGASFERFDSFDGLSLFGLVEMDTFLLAYGFGDSAQVSNDGGRTWDSIRFDDNHLLIGHIELGPDRVGLLGGSGVMLEIGPEGVIEMSRPTGSREFLSGGVRLASGGLVFISEAGIVAGEGS